MKKKGPADVSLDDFLPQSQANLEGLRPEPWLQAVKDTTSPERNQPCQYFPIQITRSIGDEYRELSMTQCNPS